MNEIATLARPYAVAAFKRAKETNSSKQWSKNLSFLAAVLSDNTCLLYTSDAADE